MFQTTVDPTVQRSTIHFSILVIRGGYDVTELKRLRYYAVNISCNLYKKV
jgi:hypothetical protein